MLPAKLNKATGLVAARENCGTKGSNPLPSSRESGELPITSAARSQRALPAFDAAEILRPRTIDRAGQDNVIEAAGARLLRTRDPTLHPHEEGIGPLPFDNGPKPAVARSF
jgi:hypothetical protein